MQRILFVTGTDTGVGKTVVTALLAAHFGDCAALKPFSSGERTDAELLASLTGGTVERINPWHYSEPVSPWTAARRAGQVVRIHEVLNFIRSFREDLLLIEGAGGVLTPLGEQFTAADLVKELGCEVILAAPNRLGVLNQTRLALLPLPQRATKVALIQQPGGDASTLLNFDDLRVLAAPVPVISIPYLEGFRAEAAFIREAAKKCSAVLKELGAVQKNPPDTEAEGTFSL